ncbi:MAG: hypothetical protein P1U56_17045 [Saprospiraceae bacterium]|nr:hypothetical protein [Saprospiraceae bacterium]
MNFLVEIDEIFTREQFQLYKKHFLDKRLGLYGVREHPKGVNSSGDIDSGPVIWGIGGAASVVGQRAMWKNGAIEEAKSIRNNLESFGMTITFNEKKKYLLGALPIADAFLCWSNSVEMHPVQVGVGNSRGIIYSISILIVVFIAKCFRLISKLTRRST